MSIVISPRRISDTKCIHIYLKDKSDIIKVTQAVWKKQEKLQVKTEPGQQLPVRFWSQLSGPVSVHWALCKVGTYSASFCEHWLVLGPQVLRCRLWGAAVSCLSCRFITQPSLTSSL